MHKLASTLGIDLGLTNSVMAVTTDWGTDVIMNAEGSATTLNVVSNCHGDMRFVGLTPYLEGLMSVTEAIRHPARFISKRYDDPNESAVRELYSYEFGRLPNGDTGIIFDRALRWPAEICAMVLSKMKLDAEVKLGESFFRAAIAVPADFDRVQREHVRIAGRITGFETVWIVDQPTAAARAFGIDDLGGNYVVIALGAAQLNVAILRAGNGVFNVLVTRGDMNLGGDNFDLCIVNWLADEYQRKGWNGYAPPIDPELMWELKGHAEKLKTMLSEQTTARIGRHGPTLTRAELEQMVGHLIDRIDVQIEQALKDAEVSVDRIDEVLLVGGMTRMPSIRERVKKIFGMEPNVSIDPQFAIARGAAIEAMWMGQVAERYKRADVSDQHSLNEFQHAYTRRRRSRQTEFDNMREVAMIQSWEVPARVEVEMRKIEAELLVEMAQFILGDEWYDDPLRGDLSASIAEVKRLAGPDPVNLAELSSAIDDLRKRCRAIQRRSGHSPLYTHPML